MSKRTYKLIHNLLFMLTFFVLASAFYFQYMKGLQPCPLCLMQRAFAFLFAVGCLMGLYLSTRKMARVVACLQMICSAAGLFFACRQLWLQSLPLDKAPACLPGFDVLVKYFPWHDVMYALLWGTGNCAEVTWTLLGLSMAAWAACYFLFIFFVSTIVFFLIRPAVGRFENL